MDYDTIIGRRKGVRVIVKKKKKGELCARSFCKQSDEKFICIVVDVMSKDD